MKKILIAMMFLLNSFTAIHCKFEPLISQGTGPIHLHLTLKRLQQEDICKDLIQKLWNTYKSVYQVDLYEILIFNDYLEKKSNNSCKFYSLLSSLIDQNSTCIQDNQTESDAIYQWFSQKIRPAFYKEISKD